MCVVLMGFEPKGRGREGTGIIELLSFIRWDGGWNITGCSSRLFRIFLGCEGGLRARN